MTQKLFTALAAAVLGFGAGMPGEARADDLNIAQSPLFVATNVEPNIVFTLDDSGSMQWEFMPDPVFTAYLFPQAANPYGGNTYNRDIPWFSDTYNINLRARSPQQNGIFYNPRVTYKPWAQPDGSFFPDADPDGALRNPADPTRGSIDLDSLQTWDRWVGAADNDLNYWPITFYMYDGTGSINSENNYRKFQIRENAAITAYPADALEVPVAIFDWGDGIIRTIEEEKKNFANWFTYHRSRVLTARAGIGQAFVELPDQARVGFAAINEGNRTVDGVNSGRALIRGVRSFNLAGRAQFYDSLYERVISNQGTPLRRAAEAIGEYFERTDARGPWSTSPGSSGGEDLACRQSFHILMSDGFWNGGNPGVGNSDAQNGPLLTGPDAGNGPQSYQYTPVAPFADASETNTLADVGMHYWKRDLRPDLANRVSTTPEDPAFWQHLASFGIGLGVEGNIDPVAAFAAIDTQTGIDWGDPYNSNDAKIDDLLHFGLNGRGGYFSAANAEEFAARLGEILTEIVSRTSATTGLSVSSTRLTEGSIIYSAEFDSADWSGNVKAIDVFSGSTEWEAGPQLDARTPGSRQILTSQADGTGEEEFDTDMDGALKAQMATANVNAVIEYIRGERGGEQQNGGNFRDRATVLGDIVNSRPVFMGEGNEGWARLPGSAGANYPAFVDGKEDDTKAVFVGGNGGMMHAFNAETGAELFAFVPRAVLPKLKELANPNYGHQFYADGQMVVRDAYDSGWKRVLVGGLGAGGRGMYAIDVTNPVSPQVLWEFTEEQDDDLGFTFGDPVITRLGDGTWVALFGNGYNSTDNTAHMFVIDLFDGNLISKIELESASGDNGLSGIAPLLDPEERTFLRRAYAGDLNGNVWRVDFSDSGAPSVPFANGLFNEPDQRAITTTPGLAANPSGGLNVYIGTGKLIEPEDRLLGGTGMERFYALRDQNSALGSNPDLGNPSISVSGGERVITGDPGPDGWALDLSENSTPTGERVLARPRVIFGQVIFSTFEPEDDPCAPGGVQRLYVVDALTGGGALDNVCPNCGVVEVGIGAPIDPPIIIKPPTIGGGNGGGDPDDPFDPGNGLPDPNTVGSADGWCSEFGTLNPATGQPLLIGTICDGRQVWRQAR